jgi:hypothetical protein
LINCPDTAARESLYACADLIAVEVYLIREACHYFVGKPVASWFDG